MGKLSISAWLPLGFNIVSLACITAVCLGGIYSHLSNIYFMKVYLEKIIYERADAEDFNIGRYF
jgi:hypothetical protein